MAPGHICVQYVAWAPQSLIPSSLKISLQGLSRGERGGPQPIVCKLGSVGDLGFEAELPTFVRVPRSTIWRLSGLPGLYLQGLGDHRA